MVGSVCSPLFRRKENKMIKTLISMFVVPFVFASALVLSTSTSAEEVNNEDIEISSQMDSCDNTYGNTVSDQAAYSENSEVIASLPITIDEFYDDRLSDILSSSDSILDFIERMYNSHLQEELETLPADGASINDENYHKHGFYESTYMLLSEINTRMKEMDLRVGDFNHLLRKYENVSDRLDFLIGLIDGVSCLFSLFIGFVLSNKVCSSIFGIK